MDDPAPTKSRLANLVALQEHPGWEEVRKDLVKRHERAVAGACDLNKKGKLRAADAGVASEMDQILKYVPGLIHRLEKALEKEKRDAQKVNPPALG